MNEPRRLSKLEATLGLGLITALLVALGGAYVHQLDEPPATTPRDPNWASAHPVPKVSSAVEQTAYRPVWLSEDRDAAQPTLAR